MTRNGTAAILLCTLGAAAALAVTTGHADPPIGGTTAISYRTVTETRTVNRRIEGRNINWWHGRAVTNRRALNHAKALAESRRITLHRIHHQAQTRWAPIVTYGLALARTVYGIDLTRRAFCESRNDPYAHNSSGATGLLQFLPSTWRTTPFAGFSMYDPVAQALAGGWMIRAGRSGEWTCPLG